MLETPRPILTFLLECRGPELNGLCSRLCSLVVLKLEQAPETSGGLVKAAILIRRAWGAFLTRSQAVPVLLVRDHTSRSTALGRAGKFSRSPVRTAYPPR